jgi:hypothetical protein
MTAEGGGTLLLIQHITVVSEILVTPSVFCGVFNQVNLRNSENQYLYQCTKWNEISTTK